MVTAKLALKTSQFASMAFGVGLSFFPKEMIENGYKGDTFKGASGVMAQFCLGIAGTQMLGLSILSATLARDGCAKAAQSVGCLCMGAMWIFFAFNDGYFALTDGFGGAVPVESVYANCVVFSLIGALCLKGWKDTGSVKPDTKALMFKGKAKNPALAAMINLAFFAVGCTFATEAFLDMYVPGVLGTLPGATKINARGKPYTADAASTVIPVILLILGNAGKIMLFIIGTNFAAASVGDEDTSYRLLRGGCFHFMFYLGTFARDGVLATAAGWPEPMRVATFVQCFGVCFYMINEMMGMSPKYVEAKKK